MVQKTRINWPAWISIALTIIGLTVGAVVWASNEHSAIKLWTTDEDRVIKTEIRKEAEERYVPLHEFTKVQQQLKNQSKQLDKLDKKLDKILEQLRK